MTLDLIVEGKILREFIRLVFAGCLNFAFLTAAVYKIPTVIRQCKKLDKKKERENEAERASKLGKLKMINLIYLPLMALTFVLIFWIVGLRNAELI